MTAPSAVVLLQRPPPPLAFNIRTEERIRKGEEMGKEVKKRGKGRERERERRQTGVKKDEEDGEKEIRGGLGRVEVLPSPTMARFTRTETPAHHSAGFGVK